jgi:hypothetical protein
MEDCVCIIAAILKHSDLQFGNQSIIFMQAIAFITLLSNVLKLVAMGFFVYSAYKGTFSGGGSNTVFIGVAVLTVVIVVTHIIDELRRNYT